MGILPTNGELILTLLLFHSHIENVKMSLKVDSTKLWNRAEEVVGGGDGVVRSVHLKRLITSAEK